MEKNTENENLISNLQYPLLIRSPLAFSTLYKIQKIRTHMVRLTRPSPLVFCSQSFLPHSSLLLRSNNYSMFIFGIVFSFTNLILFSFSDCLLVISKGHNLSTGRLTYVRIFDLLLVICVCVWANRMLLTLSIKINQGLPCECYHIFRWSDKPL